MKDSKLSQLIMVWLLPLIVVGGLFFPLLGYIVFFMMVFLLILSYFKGRFWCAHLCPRGSFFDLFLRKISLKREPPKLFFNVRFRWAVFALFIGIFILQFITAQKDIYSIGFVFVRMCLITTLIAVVIGLPTRARMWCTVCPMGMLQVKVGSLKKGKQDEKEKD